MPLANIPPLELKILHILWSCDQFLTVQEIIQRWPDEEKPGYTTVLKKLQIMEKKGTVGHFREGKHYIYNAIVEKKRITQMKVSEMLAQVFQNDRMDFVHSFFKSNFFSKEDLDEIKGIISSLKEEE